MIDAKTIKKAAANWTAKNLQVLQLGQNDWEVRTIEPDSFGDDVLLFVSQQDRGFRVGDDGRLLFKLDPGQEDRSLYQTAAEITLGAGYEYDQDHCEIFCEVPKTELANAIMRLAQLEVAVSYLG